MWIESAEVAFFRGPLERRRALVSIDMQVAQKTVFFVGFLTAKINYASPNTYTPKCSSSGPNQEPNVQKYALSHLQVIKMFKKMKTKK